MKKKLFPVIIFAGLFLAASTALALRYGNDLISIGDLKNEVLLICKEPLSRETIGYIDRIVSGERIRVMKIEEWIISIPLHGTTYYYSLIFEGNVLTEIKPAGEKK